MGEEIDFSFSAFVTKGSTPTTYGFSWQDDGILFLRSECVSAEGLDLKQSMFISKTAHSVLIRGEVCSGDILMTITGNVGRVVRLDANFGIANINQHIARIRVKDLDVSSDFLFHWLSQASVRANYALITTGQSYPQISLKQVRETQVSIPSFREQTAIATALSDMDAEIAALEARRDKTKDLKKGMMQELLTGRIRLL